MEGGKCGIIFFFYIMFCFFVVGGKFYIIGVRIIVYIWELLESILFYVMFFYFMVFILKKVVEYIFFVYDLCVWGKMIF